MPLIKQFCGRSEPAGRGTFGLLTSCLITLSLCVYTSLHFNVPGNGSSKVSRFFEKLEWTLVGVFAPELVVYMAWTQWSSARKLTADINAHFESNVCFISILELD